MLTTIRPLTNPERRAAWAARYYQTQEVAMLQTSAMPWKQPLERREPVSHVIISQTANRLKAECVARGLSPIQAADVTGLFRELARRDGHLVAYDTATRRAVTLAQRGVRS